MKCLIVDDEEPARARMRRLLAPYPDLEIAGEARDGLEAVQKIEELRPDLLFLDIELPGLAGFEVLHSLPHDLPPPLVIFVTGYDQHALAAFEANALAYLLKPVEPERLAQAVDRARKLAAGSEREREGERLRKIADASARVLRQIVCRKRDRMLLMPPEQILWFQVEDGIVKAHTAGRHVLGELSAVRTGGGPAGGPVLPRAPGGAGECSADQRNPAVLQERISAAHGGRGGDGDRGQRTPGAPVPAADSGAVARSRSRPEFRARHPLCALERFLLSRRTRPSYCLLMKKILLFAFVFALAAGAQDSPAAKIAGKWQMSMETPHGVVKGPFDIGQDGAKLTVTLQTEMFGKLSGTGSVEGNKVSFHLSVPNGPQSFGFSGTVDGSKMSGTNEMGGAWSATRETAQAARKPVLGTVTDFRVESLELGVKPGRRRHGLGQVRRRYGRAAGRARCEGPGGAQPARITDIARGDRVLVSFVEGMPEARRIVVVSASDIARRNAAERLDWEKRGISGVVSGRDGDDIVVETRSPEGAQHTTVVVTAKTTVRRYAPDSVKFADAQPAPAAEIAVGDQLRARGDRSADGGRVTAQDVVFGEFLTTLGKVESVDRQEDVMRIVDLATKKPLVVRITADTQMKKLPDMRQEQAGHGGHGAPENLAKMLQQLPAGALTT